MTPSDFNAVIRIHERVLPTATARMGILSFFYKTMISNPFLHIALVATENKRIVGAITATRDAHQTQTFLSRPSLLFPVLSAVMTRRITIRELIDRLLTERAILALAHPYQTILTLIVDIPWQRNGIGKKLVSALPMRGTLYVDTETSNAKAQSFYERLGFRFIKTIRSSIVAVKTLNTAPKRKILG